MLSLDIGCGDYKRGNVGIDKYRFSPEIGAQTHFFKTKADVIAIGEYLPFKSECFDRIVSFHVIEHSANPELFLKEAIRVCKNGGFIIIRCPHRFSRGAKKPFHKQYLSLKWFSHVLSKIEGVVWIADPANYWGPIPYAFFNFPDEITVRIEK